MIEQDRVRNAIHSFLGAAAGHLKSLPANKSKNNLLLALAHLTGLRTRDLINYGIVSNL
jgi:hypothetical protein